MSAGAAARDRRYFWGQTLAQALMAAARFHRLPPDRIAYRIFEKQHGYLRNPRRFVIVVDPDCPAGAADFGGSAPAPLPAPEESRKSGLGERSQREPLMVPPTGAPEPTNRLAAERPRPRTGNDESYLPPDEESRLAAQVATNRLLRLANLDLEARIELSPERLEIRLEGVDEERLRALGSDLLDDLDHLLPRLIKGLSGKLVHCRIDGAGLRSAREESLRALALEGARQALESGEPVLLDPLPAAERRIVHLALAGDPRVGTESLGDGLEKRVRIFRVSSA